MRRYTHLLPILFLLGSLALSQAAGAATTSPLTPTTSLISHPAAEPEEEGEFGEEEELEEIEIEACEAASEEVKSGEMEDVEEEIEECEEAAEKGKTKSGGESQSFVTAPAECLVQRAESTITTLPGISSVQLTVHYKNYSSGAVAIGLRLKDQKGSLSLERTTRQLGRSGVLHLTTKLGESEMDRANKAREFDIALRALDTPGYCSDLLEQHLRTKQSARKAQGSRVYGS